MVYLSNWARPIFFNNLWSIHSNGSHWPWSLHEDTALICIKLSMIWFLLHYCCFLGFLSKNKEVENSRFLLMKYKRLYLFQFVKGKLCWPLNFTLNFTKLDKSWAIHFHNRLKSFVNPSSDRNLHFFNLLNLVDENFSRGL